MSESTNRLTMPYPGLRPFEEADHPLFFGREAQVNDVLRQLEDARLWPWWAPAAVASRRWLRLDCCRDWHAM